MKIVSKCSPARRWCNTRFVKRFASHHSKRNLSLKFVPSLHNFIDAMAELGNLFGTNATSGEQKIEVEMLDYGYIRDCNDWNQMSAIVDVLKSGKEGYYPDVRLRCFI